MSGRYSAISDSSPLQAGDDIDIGNDNASCNDINNGAQRRESDTVEQQLMDFLSGGDEKKSTEREEECKKNNRSKPESAQRSQLKSKRDVFTIVSSPSPSPSPSPPPSSSGFRMEGGFDMASELSHRDAQNPSSADAMEGAMQMHFDPSTRPFGPLGPSSSSSSVLARLGDRLNDRVGDAIAAINAWDARTGVTRRVLTADAKYGVTNKLDGIGVDLTKKVGEWGEEVRESQMAEKLKRGIEAAKDKIEEIRLRRVSHDNGSRSSSRRGSGGINFNALPTVSDDETSMLSPMCPSPDSALLSLSLSQSPGADRARDVDGEAVTCTDIRPASEPPASNGRHDGEPQSSSSVSSQSPLRDAAVQPASSAQTATTRTIPLIAPPPDSDHENNKDGSVVSAGACDFTQSQDVPPPPCPLDFFDEQMRLANAGVASHCGSCARTPTLPSQSASPTSPPSRSPSPFRSEPNTPTHGHMHHPSHGHQRFPPININFQQLRLKDVQLSPQTQMQHQGGKQADILSFPFPHHDEDEEELMGRS